MRIEVRPTTPIEGQKPGTSGLRKKTRVFMERNYLENFIQATFDAIGGASGKRFVVGGDGRYFNKDAIQDYSENGGCKRGGACHCWAGRYFINACRVPFDPFGQG